MNLGDQSVGRSALLDKLQGHLKISSSEVLPSIETYLTVCGKRGSGQTSLIQKVFRYSNETPSSTVGLGYRCLTEEDSERKKIAHIYDIGGDIQSSNLLNLSLTSTTLEHAAVFICIDMSKPSIAFKSCAQWYDVISRRVEKCTSEMATDPKGNSIVTGMRERLLKMWDSTPGRLDAPPPPCRAPISASSRISLRENINKCPVPIILIATKWDILTKKFDVDASKSLSKALRIFAAQRGIGIVTCSQTSGSNDEQMQRLKMLVRGLLVPNPRTLSLNQNINASNDKNWQSSTGFGNLNSNISPKRPAYSYTKRVVESDSESDSSEQIASYAQKSTNTSHGIQQRKGISSHVQEKFAVDSKFATDRIGIISDLGRTLFNKNGSHKGLFILPGTDSDLKILPEDDILQELVNLFGDGSKEIESEGLLDNGTGSLTSLGKSFKEDTIDLLCTQKQYVNLNQQIN